MARVILDSYLKENIIVNTDSIMRRKVGRHEAYKAIPEGLADELMSAIIPLEQEKEARALLPDYALPMTSGINVGIRIENEALPPGWGGYWRNVSAKYSGFESPRILIQGRSIIRNIPGVEELRIENGNYIIVPAVGDGTGIQLPTVKQFVSEAYTVWKANLEKEREVLKATGDMQDFLNQYRTLNKAVDVFGPALFEYVPAPYKDRYNQVEEKREAAPKKKAEPIDLTTLITAAAEHRLQLN